MAEPIYKVFMARFSEAWYQLSEEEQNSFKAKMDEAVKKAGGKRLMICGTNWSSDQCACLEKCAACSDIVKSKHNRIVFSGLRLLVWGPREGEGRLLYCPTTPADSASES